MRNFYVIAVCILFSTTTMAAEYYPQCITQAEAISNRIIGTMPDAKISPVRYVGRYYDNVEVWETTVRTKSGERPKYSPLSYGIYKFSCTTLNDLACTCEWVTLENFN